MNFDILRIYFHINFRRILSLLYIFLSIVVIFLQLLNVPTFYCKYNILNNTVKANSHLNRNGINIKIDPKHQNSDTIQNDKDFQRLNESNFTLFPIDLVYTWVDGRDPKWLKEFRDASAEQNITIKEDDFNNRFVDNDELRYSLRSVEKNLPWIRFIFIVTWENQHPDWINLHSPKIKFISHSAIFPKTAKLPTFNSKSIDFLLYRIPGLSEHFIYSNDDMYFGHPLKSTDFFTPEGKPIIYSKKNNWASVRRRYAKFQNDYIMNKDDAFLFMVSLFYTIVKFEEKFNKIMKYEYSHIPVSLTKEICEEVFLNFNEEINHTIFNRFRSQNDFQMQTIMIQYSLFSNKSIVKPKTADDVVFVIASMNNNEFKNLPKILDNVPKFISINIDEMKFRDKIKAFLDFVFIQPSSFELKEKPPFVNQKLRDYWLANNYSQFIADYC